MASKTKFVVMAAIGVAAAALVILMFVFANTESYSAVLVPNGESAFLKSFDAKTLEQGEIFKDETLGIEWTVRKSGGLLPPIMVDPKPAFFVPGGQRAWLAILAYSELNEKNVSVVIVSTSGYRAELLTKNMVFGQTQFNLPENDQPEYVVLSNAEKDLVRWKLA